MANSPEERDWDRFYRGLLLARRRGAHDLSVLERLRRVREHLAVFIAVPKLPGPLLRVPSCFVAMYSAIGDKRPASLLR